MVFLSFRHTVNTTAGWSSHGPRIQDRTYGNYSAARVRVVMHSLHFVTPFIGLPCPFSRQALVNLLLIFFFNGTALHDMAIRSCSMLHFSFPRDELRKRYPSGITCYASKFFSVELVVFFFFFLFSFARICSARAAF